MKKFNSAFLSIAFGVGATSSVALATPLFNQLGFTPSSEKIIVIPGSDANPLEIRDNNGKTILKLEAPLVYDWDFSGEEVQSYDISALKDPGMYRIYRDGYMGNAIVIGDKVYEDLARASLKWFC